MEKVNLEYIYKMKKDNKKLARTALYNYPMARIASDAGIEIINVGDTLATYGLGFSSTNKVGLDILVEHAKAVRLGAPNSFVMGDMPFLSYTNEIEAIKNAGRYIKEADLDCVKVEGGFEIIKIIKSLTDAGIPVIGHTGLKLQSRAIGLNKTKKEVEDDFLEICKEMENAGAIALVYTEVPEEIAKKNYESINIPIFAAGAGKYTDSPMINFYELLGLTENIRKFAKRYDNLYNKAVDAAKTFVEEVHSNTYKER